MIAAMWLRLAIASLAACLLTSATMDGPQSSGHPQRPVRVATGPMLRPFPEQAQPDAPPTIAHRYANLVARHSGLSFVEQPHESTLAAIAAVCARQADLVLVQGAATDLPLPCTSLIQSRPFRGGDTILAGPLDTPLPHDASGLSGLKLAAVEGDPYPAWLAARHPQTQILAAPNMHAALALVDAGTADAAIGLEASLRPVFRRDFHDSLRVQPLRGDFPHELHLLARHSDQQLIDRIEDALARITIDEHAALLQGWARQTLADRWHDATIQTPRWVLPVISMALLALFVSFAVSRRRHGRLQAQQRERNHASGMVNHEVRNAAQAMVTAVDLLKQSALPAGAHELASIAANAGQTLRRLLNRALDFSRLADGSFRPRPRPCAPAEVCTQAVQAAMPQAQQRGLRLQLHADDALPPVLVDPDCLRQILDNLLGNALKFTDVGGVDLRVELDAATHPARLQIEVVDSGIGIAPAQMAELFAPYRQADGGHERGGSGLGLSICRQLAQAMGGTLGAHSVHGRGSRFILRVPVRVLDEGALAQEALDTSMPLGGLQVLLVDDHVLNRRVIAAQLQQLGADVCEADGPAAALAQQAASPASVVLLDIELDAMDGYALATGLRAQERHQANPAWLLALSAHSGDEHLQRCQRAGFDGVLVKPLQIERLLEALDLGGTDSPPATALSAQLLADYEQDIRTEMALLQKAVDARDAPALRHHAHRLQGVLQMRGVAAMQDVAGELWSVGNGAAPDWSEAQRLLRVLRVWRGDLPAAPEP